MAELKDPGEPSDAGGMRAKNLKNLPLIVLPKSEGIADGTDGPYRYVACDVWVLDRAGIVDAGTDVQFSWKRILDNLAARMGEYVACRPVEDGSSMILAPLVDDAHRVAEQALKEIEASAPFTPSENQDTPDDGDKPF